MAILNGVRREYGVVTRSALRNNEVLEVRLDGGDNLLLNLRNLGIQFPDVNVGDGVELTLVNDRVHQVRRR